MTTSVASTARGAEVTRIPPPLFFALPFLLGLLLQKAFPLTVAASPATGGLGAVVAAAGLFFMFSGVAAVHRAGTTIVPHHPVTVLLTRGPYSRTRNPMYTGLAIAVAGGALLAGSWWPLILLPTSIAAVRLLVIGPEERYLAMRFGDDYNHYRSAVRRWI